MCNFMVTIWNTGKDHFFFFTLENRYIDRPIAVISENYFGHMKFSKLHLQSHRPTDVTEHFYVRTGRGLIVLEAY